MSERVRPTDPMVQESPKPNGLKKLVVVLLFSFPVTVTVLWMVGVIDPPKPVVSEQNPRMRIVYQEDGHKWELDTWFNTCTHYIRIQGNSDTPDYHVMWKTEEVPVERCVEEKPD